MKKKLLALVCALVMIFSLASCGLSTPDTVGKVGDFEVSSGLYLLAQFSAYQQAAQLVAAAEQHWLVTHRHILSARPLRRESPTIVTDLSEWDPRTGRRALPPSPSPHKPGDPGPLRG